MDEVKPSTADRLRNAKEVILTRGWTRGNFEQRGRVCILGALNVAHGRVPGNFPSFEISDEMEAIGRAIGYVCDFAELNDRSVIADWNDAKDRTRGQVLKALDRAIEMEESGDG